MPRGWVIVADPIEPRARGMLAALAGHGLRGTVVSYAEVLAAGPRMLREMLGAGDVLRLDSPGRNPEVQASLLARGAAAFAGEGGAVQDPRHLRGGERGLLVNHRQWYLGFRSLLEEIEAELVDLDVLYCSHPGDVALAFDKPRTLRCLAAAGVPTPPALGKVATFEQLRVEMVRERRPRVFLKPCHGSSGSGLVAYERGPQGEQAWTTVEVETTAGQARLFNTRRLQRLRRGAEIARLVDALTPQGLWAEAWVPKAGIDGRTCDLRAVVIAGRRAHATLRLSKGPVTNLHLLNERADPTALQRRMGSAPWRALDASCRAAAACFPRSLHVALDIAVEPSYRHHAVLEVNAFGDLLQGVLKEGRTTYEAEVEAVLGGAFPASPTPGAMPRVAWPA